jgi:hypothetical protein
LNDFFYLYVYLSSIGSYSTKVFHYENSRIVRIRLLTDQYIDVLYSQGHRCFFKFKTNSKQSWVQVHLNQSYWLNVYSTYWQDLTFSDCQWISTNAMLPIDYVEYLRVKQSTSISRSLRYSLDNLLLSMLQRRNASESAIVDNWQSSFYENESNKDSRS